MFCVIIPPEEKLEDPESSFFYSYRQNRLGRIKNFIWFCFFGFCGFCGFFGFYGFGLLFSWCLVSLLGCQYQWHDISQVLAS